MFTSQRNNAKKKFRNYGKSHRRTCVNAACASGNAIVPRRDLGFQKVSRMRVEMAEPGRLLTQSQTASSKGYRTAMTMFME